MIAITGATGTIGSQVLAALLREGSEIRALVRKRPEQTQSGVEYLPVDLMNAASVAAALDGVEKVFLVAPNGNAQLQMELNVVKAAAEKRVKQIVKLSVMGASVTSPIIFARLHGEVEDAARASGCAWTFIRSNMFMQNLFWYKGALQQGTVPLPLGTARVSHVDGNDVAAAAAGALLGAAHAGKAYTVTGPEALSGAEVAAVLSRVLERSIEYQPVSSSDFRAYLKGTGEAEQVVDAEVELFAYWSEGYGSEVTHSVAELKGTLPVTLEEFALREKARLV